MLPFNEDLHDRLHEQVGLVMPLALQMLVENAVKHNVVSKEFPLTVEIFTKDGKFICVKNMRQQKNGVESTGFGLQNIRARSELLGRRDFEVIQVENYFQVNVPLFNP